MTASHLRQTLYLLLASLAALPALVAQQPGAAPLSGQPRVTPPALNPAPPQPGLNTPPSVRSAANSYRPGRTLQNYLWEYPLAGFSEQDYEQGVNALLKAYEQAGGKSLVPGPKGRVAIKLYTESGPGLMTPPALTLAVIDALKERGFSDQQIVLVGLREESLRACGYLPAIGAADQSPLFGGVQVVALDTGALYNKVWFYDSNLPSREALAAAARRTEDLLDYRPDPEERKSYLNTLLFLDTDFWINLPVAADNPALGVSGALANASLWNISNNERFFDSPANAPVAAAEISAIPELRDTWALTILSLETYQYLGGPRFNAVYSGRERRLWLSANPVVIDYLMWERFKPLRARYGFSENTPEPPLLQYASNLGLGGYNLNELRLLRLPAPAGATQENDDD